jgi:uncharacterized protein YgiM (DUF1202 family)
MSRHRVLPVLVLLCSVAVGVWAAGAKIMSVQVKQSELRASPSGLSSVVATLKEGDQLTVVEEKGAWTKVTFGDKTGWIPAASLVKGVLKVKAGGSDAKLAASGSEMATATKGFTSQVEADFKSKHSDIDFSWVEKMGQMKVTASDMQEFLKDGKVEAAKGGVQ